MNLPRRALFASLDALLFQALESATSHARLLGNPHVELCHWLHQVLARPDSDLHRLLEAGGCDVAQVTRDCAAAIAALPARTGLFIDFSHQLETVTERAWLAASLRFGLARTRSAALLWALRQTPELWRTVASLSPVLARIDIESLAERWDALLAGSPEGAAGAPPAVPLPAAEASPAGESALDRYCTDLTARARDAAIDPVLGRSHEIRTLIDILLRRRQNNPLLTGEAGVGKTAVVEGLALAIAAADVPPALRGVRLLALDVAAMLAGAGVRGEFEARLKRVLAEVERSGHPIVLFIDEVHTLVGAGGHNGTGDAANLLKPALARGSLRTIGATTWAEFKRHVEKDPAFARRFQVLPVAEPDEAAAIDMVRGLAATLSSHHGVAVLDEAVRAAVVLSHRYIPARQLPDKAISLLDTACARVALSQHAPPGRVLHLRQQRDALQTELDLLAQQGMLDAKDDLLSRQAAARLRLHETTADLAQAESRWTTQVACMREVLRLRQCVRDADGADRDALAGLSEARQQLQAAQGEMPWVHVDVDRAVVAAVVADWTGIPLGDMVSDDVRAALELEERLARRVVGQPAALAAIARRVRASRAGLTAPDKPVGVFMLAGLSGVGKTETALALAQALHGDERHLITLNMSEYQEPHTVSSLKGAPPGYVGYGEGGALTEAVRRRPYSVVLLDEIEKAHPDVHELFYQVFDKGWMEDGEGRHIDFRNTLILLTSNVGSQAVARLHEHAAMPTDDALAQAINDELAGVFPAAFLGRLVVVPYRPLSRQVQRDIATLQLQRLSQRMAQQHQVRLSWDDAVVDHIVAACDVARAGARRMNAYIEQHLLPPLADRWLSAMQQRNPPCAVHVSHSPDSGSPFLLHSTTPPDEGVFPS